MHNLRAGGQAHPDNVSWPGPLHQRLHLELEPQQASRNTQQGKVEPSLC